MESHEYGSERSGDALPKCSVYLKRIKDGYTWSLYALAPSNDEAGMLEAVRLCRATDLELRELFPTPDAAGELPPAKGAKK
jgi:hypothetical protein